MQRLIVLRKSALCISFFTNSLDRIFSRVKSYPIVRRSDDLEKSLNTRWYNRIKMTVKLKTAWNTRLRDHLTS